MNNTLFLKHRRLPKEHYSSDEFIQKMMISLKKGNSFGNTWGQNKSKLRLHLMECIYYTFEFILQKKIHIWFEITIYEIFYKLLNQIISQKKTFH